MKYSSDPIQFIDDGMPPPDFSDETYDEIERQENEYENKKRSPDQHKFQEQNEDDKTWTLNQLRIPTKTKERCVKEANERWLGLERYIVFALDDYHSMLDTRRPVEGDSIESRIRWRMARSEEIAEKYSNAFRIASLYADHPTDELMEMLTDSCGEIGLDPQDLLDRIQRDPIARAVASMKDDSNTVINRCAKWLARLFKDKDMLPSKQVNALARESGWAEQHVRRARNRLGMEIRTIDGVNCVIVPGGSRVLLGSEYED